MSLYVDDNDHGIQKSRIVSANGASLTNNEATQQISSNDLNPRSSNTQDTLRLDEDNESDSDEAPDDDDLDDESDEGDDDLSEESNDDDLNSVLFQLILEIKLKGVNIT